jgi:hypothetical protein
MYMTHPLSEHGPGRTAAEAAFAFDAPRTDELRLIMPCLAFL